MPCLCPSLSLAVAHSSCFCYWLSHTLSALAPSPSICRFCLFFMRMPWQKMRIDCAFSVLLSLLHSPFFPSLYTPAEHALFRRWCVEKSSRNAPCKGKKRWWYNQFYCAVRIFSGLWFYTPYAGAMKELQFACIFPAFFLSFHCSK